MRDKDKREYILELYAEQIESIPFQSADGVDFQIADAYICPLCLRAYAIGDNDKWTLEHVPPKSVGGKPILITCKECNNNQGANTDVNLTNELEILYNINHLDTVPQTSRIALNGVEINAQTTFSKNEGFKFTISPNNNNPIEFEGFMSEIKNAKNNYQISVVANITNRIRDTRLANIALLKSAYLMAFREFGYMYVLNPNTNIVREQILNPSKTILKAPFVVANENGIPKDLAKGVYYALFNKIGCVVVIMELKLPKSELKLKRAIVLPHPKDSHPLIYTELDKHIGSQVNLKLFNKVSSLPISTIKLDINIHDIYDKEENK